MFRNSSYRYLMMIAAAALMAGAALAGTFGTVVPIGGEASDIALDTSRGVLYIANFTTNQINVMNLATNQIHTSINVDPNPSSISLSPDFHWLLVAHYGNNTAPATAQNELTLIDLTAGNAKQTFALGNPPLGVAFGLDDQALVVTTSEFILFNPALGTTQLLKSLATAVTTPLIPTLPVTFPTTIVQASVATSKDMLTVAGLGGGTNSFVVFKYTVADHTVTAVPWAATPPGGPRAVSVADDGSMFSFAWWTTDSNFNSLGEYNGDPAGPYGISGLLQLGSSVIDTSRGLIYAHMPPKGTSATVNTATPILQILDQDNLTLRDQLVLQENLAGKSLLSDDHNTMYAISDSGVMVLPVGNLSSVPRLSASSLDMVFRGNFCNRATSTQTLTITDPGGGNTPFTISSSTPGLTVSPTSGITPAIITVAVDPNAFSTQKGTVTASLPIASTVAANLPQAVRVLINSEDVSQRGNFVDIPGRVVDVLADPKRNVYYVMVQNKNQIQIYDGTANIQTNSLRTCTSPSSMAITFDQQYLLIGCNHSQRINVYDLDTLQAQLPIVSNLDYVQSIAVSSNAILASTLSAGDGTYGIDAINMVNRTYARLPQLGVWQNGLLDPDTALAASSNGSNIIAAGSKGQVMIYNANSNTFTVSRQDYASLAGSYAASSFNQFVVGNHLLDVSGVKVADLSTSTGNPSGFAFVDQGGYYTTAASTAAPGVIAQVSVPQGSSIQPTTMVEAPFLSPTGFASTTSTTSSSCTTSTSGSTTVQTCTSTVGSTVTTSTQTCNTTTVGGTVTQVCTNSSGSTTSAAPPIPPLPNNFTRSLAPLPSRTALISLTTSGFTVLPWSYAASVAPPQISNIVSAADGVSPAAPGGLISIFGSQLSATNLASSELPLPTALANSCLTVDGQPMPIVFVSPNQINAQMPSQAIGDVVVEVHTPGGISDDWDMLVMPTAPAVFTSGTAGPITNIPTLYRVANGLLVTDSNPVKRGDTLVALLTGCGATNPAVPDGMAAPANPPAMVINPPVVTLAGRSLQVGFAGLAAGQVGVCQFNVNVPNTVPTGLSMPLMFFQDGASQTLNVRVID